LGQVTRFAVVGLLNTVVDAGLYFLLTRWLGLAELPALAKGLSYGAGVLNSYFWNRSWTFRSAERSLGGLALFGLANVAALAMNAGVMHLGLVVVGWPEVAVLGLATGVTLGWNFGVSKFVVFRA
jgi:putative flippase GtrA